MYHSAHLGDGYPITPQLDIGYNALMITVVTPTLNAEKFLLANIKSVCNNSMVEKHIIVDGGSIDSSPYIIESSKKFSRKINNHLLSGSSQIQALEFGAGLVKSKYLLWVNSDEFIPANSHDFLNLESGNVSGPIIIFGDWIRVDEFGRFVGLTVNYPLSKFVLRFRGCVIQTISCVFRVDKIKHIVFDPKTRFLPDWDIFLQLDLDRKNTKYVRQILGIYTVHRDQISNEVSHKQFEERTYLYKKYKIRKNSLIASIAQGLHGFYKLVYGAKLQEMRASRFLGVEVIDKQGNINYEFKSQFIDKHNRIMK